MESSTDTVRTLDFVVLGTARSGTTALGNALNLEPSVFCATEYFRRSPNVNYSQLNLPNDFLSGKYRASNERNTVESRRILNHKLARQQVLYYGNKVPNYYLIIRRLHRVIPPLKSVALFRDPISLARSWDKRAQNVKDPWPNGRTGIVALLNWAIEVSAYSEGINGLFIAAYEALFYRNPDVYEEIFSNILPNLVLSDTSKADFLHNFFRGPNKQGSQISRSMIDSNYAEMWSLCDDSGCFDLVSNINDLEVTSTQYFKTQYSTFGLTFLKRVTSYTVKHVVSGASDVEADFLCKWLKSILLGYDDRQSSPYRGVLTCIQEIAEAIHPHVPSRDVLTMALTRVNS